MTQPDAPVNGVHAGIAAVINEIDVAVYRFAAGGPQADGVVSRDAPIGSGGKRCRATSPWANSPLIFRTLSACDRCWTACNGMSPGVFPPRTAAREWSPYRAPWSAPVRSMTAARTDSPLASCPGPGNTGHPTHAGSTGHRPLPEGRREPMPSRTQRLKQRPASVWRCWAGLRAPVVGDRDETVFAWPTSGHGRGLRIGGVGDGGVPGRGRQRDDAAAVPGPVNQEG